MTIRRFGAALAAVSALLLVPGDLLAQSVGVGPRFSFVRPDATLDSPSDRYTGGALRLKLSPRTSIELAMDWRSTTSADETIRISDYPFQGSLMLYPLRSAISPYVLGGIGWYSQRMQTLAGSDVLAQQTVRRRGYHGGLGGELKLGSRMSLFADYRYTFISFGDEDAAEGAGAFPIPGAASLMEHFRLSHEGSMWTGGLVINF